MLGEVKMFLFKWQIECYSLCLIRGKEYLSSPEFVVEILKETVWSLRLWPRHEEDGRTSLCLVRLNDSGPNKIKARCQLSFLDSDGETLAETGNSMTTWDKGSVSTELSVSREAFKQGDYLYRDTLTICCTLMTDLQDVEEMVECYARTRMQVQRSCFIGTVDDFEKSYREKQFVLKERSLMDEPMVNLVFSTFQDDHADDRIRVAMTLRTGEIEGNPIKYMICKLFILARQGLKIECGRCEHVFKKDSMEVVLLPLYFWKSQLDDRKGNIYMKGALVLQCEFAFSTGIEFSEVEETVYGSCATLSFITSPRRHLGGLLQSEEFTDLTLLASHKEFRVHKVILQVQSPRFAELIPQSPDNPRDDSTELRIEDISSSTLDLMLQFMYSGALQDMDWDAAVSLYVAASNYGISRPPFHVARLCRARRRKSKKNLSQWGHERLRLTVVAHIVASSYREKTLEKKNSYEQPVQDWL
ncbi:speckle-type POZ protein [Caerostris darwini]|uniref:Speckle-type POZ protein n=1 Tax=Caerostris darwini TaxID=1538125 RepID=A0AAV4SH47_9ARAC|nr:speckle-type POZ protein [Caerostris darwini]